MTHVDKRFKIGVPVLELTRRGGLHATSGLPGFPARDYFAPSGSPVVAPVSGHVSKLSGHPPAQGPIAGNHGPFGWSVYITTPAGATYYLTHLGERHVRLRELVHAGQLIGTVGDYARYGTPSHIHQGIHPPPPVLL